MIYGAIEAGGTKMVCAVGTADGHLLAEATIATKDPSETTREIVAFFQGKKIKALGLGAFGPVDLNPASPTYGHILDTPKLSWRYFDFAGTLQRALAVPVGIDTDVNAACLGEMTYGCAQGLKNVIYLTVGTGIGAGIAVDGKLLHGMLHPEAGHILLEPHPEDTYPGICPYHQKCFEGMASGPAIAERWGAKAADLHENPKVWELESYYIAQALVNYIMVLAPEKIILGGGVMKQAQLFPLVRGQVARLINGYLKTKELADLDNYIVPNSLEDRQGILGALELAKRAW
ncbi:MAG TPA: ROK family protein [Firmicutes bacterium]|nr:ROK family protein [Bacillota bacterium]